MKVLVAAALVAAMGLAGCTPKPAAKDTTTPTTTTKTGPAANSLAFFDTVVGNKVLFETDQHTLSEAARRTLDRQAEWLQANPGTTVRIEGHADERGTRQYNLALGARRSNSVRAYLVGKGVDAGRLSAVTFGKERPEAVCSEERCWSQNRRAVTVVLGAAEG